MSSRSPVVRGLLVIVLAVGVLGFGAIGLCGGYFTANVMPALLQGHGDVLVFLIISLPCVIVGIVMVKVCARKIWALLSEPLPEDDPP